MLVANHQKLADYRPNARRKNPYMALFLEIGKQATFFSNTANFAKWMDFEILDLEKKLRKQGRPIVSKLTRWYTGTYEDIADSKRAIMADGKGLDTLLKEFPPSID